MTNHAPMELEILLVAPDEPLEAMLRQQLAMPGYRFHIDRVPNVSKALEHLVTHKADAALLDLDLESTHKLDGFITLHVQAANVPVVVFAREDDTELGLAAVRAGAQGFLTRAEVESQLAARALLYAIERHALSSETQVHAAQLQFSEARFRLLINENADGIVVVNEADIIRFVNRAAEELFGRPRQELLGTAFGALLRQADDGMVELTRGAEKIWAQPRVVETLWNRENVRIVTLRDVTAERKAQLELRAAQATQEHHRRTAQALADSAAALNSTLSYEQVLDRILENVVRVVPHDAASIFLMEQGIGRFVRGKGFAERDLQELMENMRLRVSEIPGYQWMVDTGKPLLVPDTAAYADWRDLTGGWIRSYLGVPLRVHEETIGFLSLDSATPNFFDATHAADLQAFADQAATALENARLHAQVAQRAERLAAMYELMRELAMLRDPEAMLDLLVERALQIFDAPCGGLSLYLAETNELLARVIKGPLPIPVGAKIAVGVGLVGRTALLREPVVVDDYRTWEFRVEKFVSANVSAALSVPMLYGGDLVGVLSVREIGDTLKRYSQDDAQLLMMLATQAAALLHNARVNQEAEKRAQQLALVYDAGLTLNRVLEPRMQLDFLSRIAMRSVRADRAMFWRYAAESNTLRMQLAIGYPPRLLEDAGFERLALSESYAVETWVAQTRLPLRLNEAQADTRFHIIDPLLHAGIWVPVEHDNRLLGILVVLSEHRNAFTADDERLLVLFASQAAVALENARLYQSVLQENERRNILHWASQEVVSAGLDAERVYTAIHQAVSRLMPCEAIALALLDEKREQILLPFMVDRGGRQPMGSIEKGKGLSGRIIETGEPLIIGNLAQSIVPSVNFGYPVQVVSVLGVPMRHGGEIIGALLAESYDENAYDDADRVRLEMLAAHAAAALMNVRGYESLRRALPPQVTN